MKIWDIGKRYNIDAVEFEKFIKNQKLEYTETFWNNDIVVQDNLVEEYVEVFNKYQKEQEWLIQEKKKEEEEQRIRSEEEWAKRKQEYEEEEQRKQKALAEMLITSGFSFDGYTITKYSGYISGDDAISVDRGLAVFGSGTENIKDKLMESLVVIRRKALQELKEAAYDLGCNAVIGVDFDYLTLDPQTANLTGGTTYQPYVFGVTANGNAVIIEKNEK